MTDPDQDSRESETQTLRQQVDILNVAIAKEEAKASALEDRAK